MEKIDYLCIINLKTNNNMNKTMTFKQVRDLFFDTYSVFQSERRVRKQNIMHEKN